VQNKKGRKFWCIAKKAVKNINLWLLQSCNKLPTIQIIKNNSKIVKNIRKIQKNRKMYSFFCIFLHCLSHLPHCFIAFINGCSQHFSLNLWMQPALFFISIDGLETFVAFQVATYCRLLTFIT
jgi:hypothetical protein